MAVKYRLSRIMVEAEQFVIMMNPTVAVLIKLFDFYFYFNHTILVLCSIVLYIDIVK